MCHRRGFCGNPELHRINHRNIAATYARGCAAL
jgi:hypothetical protein